MQHPWNEAALQAFASACPENLPTGFIEQLFATRLLGGDAALALHGGGNTSFKATIPDILGDPVESLFIKASGCSMADVTAADFVALDCSRLRRLDRDMQLDDDAMAGFFRTSMVRPHSRQPSIETLLHAFLPFTCIDHTHPDSILALTNRMDADDCIKQAFSLPVAVLPYATVGIGLARAVADAIKRTPGCKGVIISHHGLVTWGNDAREAYDATIEIVGQAAAWLHSHRTRPIAVVQSGTSVRRAKEYYRNIAPILRKSCTPPQRADSEYRPVISMIHLASEQLLSLLDVPEARLCLASTPLTPDYIIRIKRLPLLIDAPALDAPARFGLQLTEAITAYGADYEAFISQHAAATDTPVCKPPHLPRVLFIPGVGAICTGATARDAQIAADITAHAVAVKKSIFESGGIYRDLDGDHCHNMEFRSYQRAKLSTKAAAAPLDGRIILVTGAAGAIGSGICAQLLEKGCQVAVSDLPGNALDSLVKDYIAHFGPEAVVAVPMDVTDESSVHEGFGCIIDRFGGLDAVIVNAGIAHVATLATLELDAFRRLERVNTDGTLLTIREAARLFEIQGTGGDIVLISTKNVFAPGASFGAYSATKAAAHQIARIASLELAAIDVRVNMVAPDAVFSHGAHKSGLWATVGPGRMKSRGLDEAGLEEYYRNRNLLKAKVTAPHVTAAVEFFLERRTPTTGATIPVDGGLPDATPR